MRICNIYYTHLPFVCCKTKLHHTAQMCGFVFILICLHTYLFLYLREHAIFCIIYSLKLSPYVTTLDVPNAPQRLTASKVSPFSVKLSWEPPSDNGSSPEPLTYTVTLTNITDGTVLQFNVTTTQITLTNLLPGVLYNVSVYAGYSLASGPPVVVTFRTNSSGELCA